MPTRTTVFFSTRLKPAKPRRKISLRTQWRVRAENAIYKTPGITARAAGQDRADVKKGKAEMVTILKFITILLILGAIGLVGYAYIGDLTPEQVDVVAPVALDAK